MSSPTPTPTKKLAAVVTSVLIAGVFVFCGAKAILISGTKANGTFSTVAPRPPTSPSATTNTTTTATTGSTAAPAPEGRP